MAFHSVVDLVVVVAVVVADSTIAKETDEKMVLVSDSGHTVGTEV